MLLPKRNDALAEDGTVDYFLDPDKDKTGFVLRFGFDAQTLKTALLEQARAASVDAGPRRTDTELAELVEPRLPRRRVPTVRSIWQFDEEASPGRFAPLPRPKRLPYRLALHLIP